MAKKPIDRTDPWAVIRQLETKLALNSDAQDAESEQLIALSQRLAELRSEEQRLRRQIEAHTNWIAKHEYASEATALPTPWEDAEKAAEEFDSLLPPRPSAEDLVRALLEYEGPRTWRPGEIRDELEARGWSFSDTAIRTAISRMTSRELERVDRGVYRLTSNEEVTAKQSDNS